MAFKSRLIETDILVHGTPDAVWRAWTTEAGIRSFFAPDCLIELIPGGAYEMFFNPTASEGERGGEGCKILSIQFRKMISFTWNAPPHLPTVRNQYTHVTVRLFHEEDGVRVHLTHDGWGEGGEWDDAFEYFQNAWANIVLPRLKRRFEKGPIDWKSIN